MKKFFSTKESLFSISCNNSGDIFAVGENSSIYHYNNGWTKINVNQDYRFKKVLSIGNDIWILGESSTSSDSTSPNGVLLKSQNNGQTWENKTPKLAKTLNDLYLKNGEGWLIGDEGNIFYSSDDGESWIKSESPTNNNLYCIFFLDSKNGWISGDKATILKYQN